MAETTYKQEDEAPAIPTEVTQYVGLDLEAGSTVLKALDDHMAFEKIEASDPIELTKGGDGIPVGLTPEMSAWFSRYVAPRRNAAILAVCACFSNDRFKDVPTILVEYETHRVQNEANAGKNRALNEFRRVTKDLKEDVDESRQEFETALAEQGGRQPRMVHPALYVTVLLLILILEFPINLDSFIRWLHTPLFATGATFVTAAMIGGASHVHGSLLKQHDYYFGPHDRFRKVQGRKLFSIGTAMLSAGLILAGAARYYFILPQIEYAILTGAPPPSILGSLVAMLTSNVGVYLLGCFWAYIAHDEIPDYPTKKRTANRLQRNYDAAFRRQVVEELDRLDRKATAETTKLLSRDNAQKASLHYQRNRDLFALIRGKDDDVIAALLDYRTRLSRKAEKARYLYPDRAVVTQEQTTLISAGEWAARELTLKFHTGHLE